MTGATGPSPSGRQRGPLAAVYLCVFLLAASEGALHVLVSPYLALEQGLGPGQIGAVVAVFAVASLCARLPAGAAYTQRRARAMLVGGGVLSAAAFALVPVVNGTLPFAALMALDGLGWSIATTTQLAVLVAASPRGTSTASAMGWYAGFQGLGNTAAGALGGVMADHLGFDASFLLLAALPAAATVGLVRALPSPPAPAERLPGPRRRPGTTTLRALRVTPTVVWLGVLIMGYINVINGVITTFHPVLALAAGLSLSQIGVLASCRSLASSTIRLGSGALFSRVSAARLTTPLVLLGAVPVMLMPAFAASFAWQIPLFAATGLSRGLLRVTGSAEAFDGAADSDQAHGMTAALLQSGLDAGKLAGPVVAGGLAELIGLPLTFQLLPVGLVVTYAVLRATARRAQRREPLPVS